VVDGQYLNESQLVAALRAHQRDAFAVAVAQFSGSMLATARAIAGPANAEDIVQDAWLAVFEQIDRFEGRSALKTWLQRIVTNRAISHLRSRKREVTLPDNAGADATADWFDDTGTWSAPPPSWELDTPEAILSAEALQACIDKELEEMPNAQRDVLTLRDIQQLSFDEICNELGLSASNVRVLLHRGRTRLMKMLNRFEETGSC
jgi:RNA polymerase sigma-70 factor (ECF subfamily)